MKGFLVRAGMRIFRFFWSWGFLKFVLWTITLAVLLYVEEDWRGKRAWGATKAEWEAKGESFDLNKFVPPPMPDELNLAALSLFKLDSMKGLEAAYPVVMRQAMRSGEGYTQGGELPSSGNWMKGELPDREKIRTAVATDYTVAFPGAKMPGDTLAQFEALYPFLSDLRAAVATHPLCRFSLDYKTLPPAGRGLGLLVDQIRLSKILTLDAILAVDESHPDQALADIKVNYILLSGAEGNPTLVGGLVAIGMNAICGAAIGNGLALHAWNDVQLVQIEQTLKPVDFLGDYQFDMRSVAADAVTNLEYFKKYATQADRRGLFVEAAGRYDEVFIRIFPRWPDGWWDNNKSQMATSLFHELASTDPRAHLAFPSVDRELQQHVDKATARWTSLAPWNIWFTISAPALCDQTSKFAYGQTWVDEARIACALERYRLAHGIYPGTLAELVPACIDEVPHDIMNGEPYHYRLNGDGTFLLYSVGWNQVDDGGTIAFQKDNPKSIDYEQGDWVWPVPKYSR